MQPSRSARRYPFVLILVLALNLSAFRAEGQRTVDQITIHSRWGGLGPSQSADLVIRRGKSGFLRDGKPVAAARVDALVAALTAPSIPKPEIKNLGVTSDWLKTNTEPAKRKLARKLEDATATQKELFADSFTSPVVIATVIPTLFGYTSFDDYPSANLELVFNDGTRLTAESHSYYAFMIPWTLSGKGETYNADISRALAALMPEKTVNKHRLAGEDFLPEFVEALMQHIEPEWNLRGAEAQAGDALGALRHAYTVDGAEINPYHNKEYGIPWSANGPHESNLHVTLHKASFPGNVSEELVLLYDHGKVEGVEQFLQASEKYEALAQSVPWLNNYMRAHPNDAISLWYVHQRSFGEQAMRTFALDMKARGREDLIPVVQAQQSQIALLKIGDADWILFPDKHMMLWRYEGPTGLLKWTASDFPPGRCGDYQTNYGGCSGRVITPEGSLVPEVGHRDEACVAEHRKERLSGASWPVALFAVTDHGRGGFIDQSGKIRIPLCFDTVGDFSEGLARFERDGSWGYMDETGAVLIEPKFPWAEEFSEGLAKVQVTGQALEYDGRWGFIDKTGKVVIAPVYERVMSEGAEGAFHDGLAMIEVNSKKGFIDKTGKVVIPPQFSYAYPFSEGLAAVTKSESGDDGWGYIDKTGRWAIPPQFEWASLFSEHLAPVNRTHKCGYIDPTGAQVLQPPLPPGEKDCATVWGGFSEGLSRWKFGDKYGFIDPTGKVVIKPQYELTFQFSEGLAAVMIAGKWGYIDKTGKMVIEPTTLSRAEDFHNGLAYVITKQGEHGYIDKSGNYAWKPTLQSMN